MLRLIVAVVILLAAGPAFAHRHLATNIVCDNIDVLRPCRNVESGRGLQAPRLLHAAATTLSHPSGCPRVAFCACGAAVRVFGAPVRSLWLAAAWRRFPAAAPASGMVAWRAHHAMVLEQHIQGDVWMVYDANSGRHQTRLHARSIAGFRIVNPHG